MKEFEYQGDFEIKQSIFIQNEEVKISCIKKMECKISETIFIGISNSQLLFNNNNNRNNDPTNLSFFKVKNIFLQIFTTINNSSFINFNGKFNPVDKLFQGIQNFFLNSQFSCEGKRLQYSKSKFISTSFKQNELSSDSISFSDSYFSSQSLDISFLIYPSTYFQFCIFDGKGLKNGILVSGQIKEQTKLEFNRCIFNEFVDLETSLITTSNKNPNFLQNDGILHPKDPIYIIKLSYNSYNLKLKDAQTIIDIPQSIITVSNRNFYPLNLEKSQSKNLIVLENPILYKQKLIELFSSTIQIEIKDKVDGQYFELKSHQFTQKCLLGQPHYFQDKNKRYQVQLFDKNNNPLSPQDFIIEVFALEKINISITIFFDPEQPIYNFGLNQGIDPNKIKINLNDDGSLQIDFYKLDNSIKFEIKLFSCQKGKYLNGKTCENECKNPKSVLNNICLGGKPIDKYYIQDEKYFPCMNIFCKTCTNSSGCTSCLNGLSHLDDQFCIEPSFQKIFVQENQKMVEKSCPPNCWKCTDQNKCEICSSDYVLSKDGQCVGSCEKGKFKVFEQSTCDLTCSNRSKCTECYQNPKIGCTSCQPGYLLQKQGSCIKQCLQNQYFEEGVCKSCDPSCLSCKGGTQKDCIKCQDGYTMQDSVCNLITCSENQFIFNDKCEDCYNKTNTQGCYGPYPHSFVCEKGYYAQIIQNTCKKCNIECQECEFESDNCKVCAENYNFINGKCKSEEDKKCDKTCVKCDGKKCVQCDIGYYLNQEKCLKCDNTCEECQTSSNSCIKCPISKYLQGTQCMDGCLQNQYTDDTLRKCINCDQSKCKSCKNANDECTDCENNLLLEEKKCVSTCSKGYQINDRKCEKQSQKCDQNCFKCDSGGNECTKCVINYYLNEGICSKCDKSCEECSTSSNICTKCPISKYLQGTQCLDGCLQNQYKDYTLRKCINCDQSKCKSCQNANDECTDCENNLFLEDYKCVAACSNGYKINDRKCENQSQKCDKNCFKCDSGGNECKQCAIGYYLSQGICMKCNKSCEECLNSSNICIKCPISKYLQGTQCLDGCLQNQYKDDSLRECINCDQSKCKSCQNANDECTECENNLFLEEKKCVSICSQGYQINDKKCEKQSQKCNQNCFKCDSSGNECTQCDIGYYLSKEKCMKCDKTCEECSTSSNICIKCPISKYLQDTQCLDGCLQNQYKDETLRKCINCDQSKCKSCKNANDECTDCENSLFLEEQKCVSTCSNGYTINERKCEKQISDSSYSHGIVVGIVVGCFVGVILVIVTILGVKRMKRYQKIKKQDQYVITTNNQLFSCQDIETKNQLDDEIQINEKIKVIN